MLGLKLNHDNKKKGGGGIGIKMMAETHTVVGQR